MKKLISIITWPFRQVFSILKWIVTDTFGDFKFIKRVVTAKEGEKVLDPVKVQALKDEFKKFTPLSLFKQLLPYIMVTIFALCIGYIWGLQVCSVECNNFIITEYINNPMVSIKDVTQLGYNITDLVLTS